ncbi:MAG: Ig-like domain repeat protein [Acidobacteria bacterium]|nr:Ig-like domain repeat protein [Acidobacteriota bacterium]
MKRFTSLFVIALIGALIIATGVSALVVNGDFENGTFGSWTKTAYVNNGYSSALGGGGADLSAIVGGPAVAPLSLSDSRSNNALRYPAYGHYSARVNNEQSYSSGGYSRNGNMITQNVSAYIDPADSLNHTKFAYAAVMVNPASGHTDDQKPYFRVRAINVSNGNDVLYDFASYVNEPGKNWQDGAAFGGGEFWKYLNWQVIDLTSSPVHPVNSGDNIRIEVSASGCSLGGHPGYVYVDEITDNEIAGPTVRATGPSGADQGSTITYTYNYKNGSAGSIDPTVTATQPTGVTFTSVTDPNCSLSGGTVTCNFTNVPAGGSGSFTVNGTVTASTGFQIAHGAYSIAAPGFPTVGGQTVLTTVTSVGTSTTVGSSVNPSVSGQSVTFTATVAPTSGSNTPTGTVQFSIDGSPVGSPVALSGGTASFTTSSLSVGNHPVGVSYGGNPGFNPSSGSLAGGQTVNKANSATVVSTSPNPSDFGQTVTLTANISAAAPGSDVPSGTVQFAIDGSNFGSPVAVSGSGIAQLTTSAMAVGAHNIGASYNGNANFNSSSGSTTHQVDNADSTTSVVSSLPTSTYGQSVTFTATVTVDPPGVGTPGGTVSFFDGATPIPGCQNLPLNGSGQAQCSTANLTGGFHNISVVYSGNGSFNGGSGNVTQNVNKATLGVTASSHTVTYGDAVPAVTPSYTGFVLSQGPGDLTAQPSCTTSYTQSSSAAGSPYSTSCSGGVSGNYDFAPTNGTVTVNKAALTVTASSHTVTFGDAAPTVTPSYSGFVLSQGPANLTTAPTCSTTYTAGSTAANSPYSSSCGGGVSDNYSFSYTGGTVAVDKAMLTVTASSHAVTFGDAAPNVTPAYSGFVLSQGPANLATAPTCSTTYTAGSTAANSPYTSSCGGGVSDNYSFTYTGGTVAVDKAILTVTASSHTVTFGDAAPTVTPSYSGFVLSQGPANLSTAPTCSTTYAAGSTAANSPYPTACVGGVSSNYSFSYTNGSVTVGKATLTVTASSHTVFYGSLVPTITPSYAGFVLGQNAASLVTRPTCSTTYLYGTGVADPLSSTTCSGGVSPNYAFVYVNGAVTVTKTNTATYVATLINPPVYGQTLTATATITAVAPGGGTPQGTVSFFDGATPIVGCQDVPVTPLGAATCSSNTLAAGVNKSISAQYSGNSNYNPSNGATTQTIGKATLNVTASSHTVTYGDAAPSITSTITGFALGETIVNITPPTCSTTYAQGSPVSGSQYPATCSGAVSANYNFNYAGGYVTVNKKALTVTADNKLRTYGAANPPFTATIAGFVLGQNQGTSDLTGSPLLTTTATSSSSVNGGPYTITASLGTLNSGNYSFNFINGQLTIDKAVLTITANNASRVFGSPNPAFSGSYSGFVNGESLPTSGTTGTPSLTTAAVQTSPVGTYDIVVGSGNLAAANYSFAFVNGTLTVNKAPTITTITNAAAIAAGSSRVGQGFDVNWTSVPESPITGTPDRQRGRFGRQWCNLHRTSRRRNVQPGLNESRHKGCCRHIPRR